ncbi:MAG TPA: CHAT domain-containing protein, partial [Propionicimonas sp.]|nr:CHAT domain-containing protein [Propionicimonas sp.]
MTDRIEYLDFDVEVEATPTADAYTVQVISSPKGEASATMTFPFSSEGLENVILKLGRTRSGVRALGSPSQDLARTFGTALYDAVFAGEVGTCFRRSLDAAEAAGKGLRLRLRLGNAPLLADVPWEYLYPAGLRKFLVLSRHTPVVRYLDLPREVAPLHVEPPLNVLLVVSAPTDLATLDVTTEVARIQQALAELEARNVVKVTTLETATLAELRRALRRGVFHVLHFIGHGGFNRVSGEGMLAFEDDQRRAHLVSGTDLATLVQDHRTLRLAMLNACEGARQSPADPFSGVAQALVQNGLPAVVAMQFEITDAAALVLAHEFYSAIADGYPIDAALAEARVAVFSEGNDVEWGTPVLYLRASDANIFDLAAAPEAGTEAARAGRTVAPDPPEAAAAAVAAATLVIQDAAATTQVAPSPRPVPVEPVPTEPIQTVPIPMEPIQTGSLEVPADIYRVDSPATPPVWPGAALGAPAGAGAPHGPGPAPVPTPDTARMQAQPAPPSWAPPPAMSGPAGVPGAIQPPPQPQRKRRGPWVALGVA